MTMEKSWVMMKDRADKEHKEWEEACAYSTSVGHKLGLSMGHVLYSRTKHFEAIMHSILNY